MDGASGSTLRMSDNAEQVQRMTEEAYYWFSKAPFVSSAGLAQHGMRMLLAKE
jgi:hypothetical protein